MRVPRQRLPDAVGIVYVLKRGVAAQAQGAAIDGWSGLPSSL